MTGRTQAVAVVDTGVDAKATSFRGRVAPGINVITGGLGNQDLGGGRLEHHHRRHGRAGRHGRHRRRRQFGPVQHDRRPWHAGRRRHRPVRPRRHHPPDQHLQPVLGAALRSPAERDHRRHRRRHGGGSGGGGTGTGGTIVTNDQVPRPDALRGLQYLVRTRTSTTPSAPGRSIASSRPSTPSAPPTPSRPRPRPTRQYPQLVAALKNEYHKLRKEGIANIAATGEFGAPLLSGAPRPPPPPAAPAAPEAGHDWHHLPGRQQRREPRGGRREGHLPARRPQRGDLGHGRLFLPVHPHALDLADRHAHRRHPPAGAARSCSSAPA